MAARERSSYSFSNIDTQEASSILSDVIQGVNARIGCSSMGQGLKRAAKTYIKQQKTKDLGGHFNLPGAADLEQEADKMPAEEPFYVVDLGVVVSQVYQWRRFFPRVEPFYAVKCNPDPVIIQTLATLGCNFDCASRNEIRLVEECTKNMPRRPEIIFANPCKPLTHLMEAVCKGVRMVTFDNATEVQKCAGISKKIQLILRIMTDDRGSQCRLSSKFGAPPNKWFPLLAAAKRHGMEVVGVSFHVGSGCRDATRYEAALKDARSIFDMAESDFGMKMHLLDIGGGFPGETYSMWNPEEELDEDLATAKPHMEKISENGGGSSGELSEKDRFMFFNEIATSVAPLIDQWFSPEVRVIGEPGRYFVAACSTLCCTVIAARSNELDASFEPEPVNDKEVSQHLHTMTRQESRRVVSQRGKTLSMGGEAADEILASIHNELADYSMLFASQQLVQQEVDVYNDVLDFSKEGFSTAADLLGPPDESQQKRMHHTAEGMTTPMVTATGAFEEDAADAGGLITLAAAGEAAVNGVVLQAVADSAPLQDDYAYYINDGVYGAFNNVMFDHATIRPRVLEIDDNTGHHHRGDTMLYSTTVFGPTCDSIDVIARTVLLPKLKVGDWMYFENMGAYTSAASSTFNGFTPSDKLYVCSVMPEYFEAMIAGPKSEEAQDLIDEEKKDDPK